MNSRLAQELVRAFWDSQPCDSGLSTHENRSRAYFADIERRRYELQPHIPRMLSGIAWRGRRVLEIGTGVGTDARFIIDRGGSYTGVNIDQGSTEMTAAALRAFSLPGTVLRQDATALQFPDASFDVVYSFGVLHHIPEAHKAVAEIHRVLKPGGVLLVMVYNRTSINYAVEIMFLRRIGVRLLALPGVSEWLARIGFPREKLERHASLRKQRGRMSPEEWLSRNTDGPDNPYSRVYDAAEIEALLAPFDIAAHDVYFFDRRHWGPLGGLLPRFVVDVLGRRWGWHRVVRARKRSESTRAPRAGAALESRRG
jgi:SAM-dependent methyltransferase